MEGKHTFTWIVEVRDLDRLLCGEYTESSTFEAEMLKGTKWCLRLRRPIISMREDVFECKLCIFHFKASEYNNITAALNLELVNEDDEILKSISKYDCCFFEGSYVIIEDFIDLNSLKLYRNENKDFFIHTKVKIRCQIIAQSNIEQKIEIPTVVHTQWKVTTPELPNWSKKMKLPFYERAQIDITISDSDEVIDIKIEKEDFQKPYTLKITVLNNEDREIDFKGSKSLFQSTDENDELETWIEKSELVDADQFYQPYSFTLIFILSLDNDNSPIYPIGKPLPDVKASPLPLQAALRKMLLKKQHSDIKLRSNSNIIPVHKCLLSVRSPMFSRMFDQGMLETQTGIVDIPDVESETLRAFLEYLYTDTIPTTDFEKVLKLLLVADKYQVNDLKDSCSKILISSLSLENVCEVISVSEMVNQENLKLCALGFIKENKIKVISSPLWSEWMKKNKDLAIEILVKLIID